MDFALDREDIADAIRRGVCEFSGVPFALHYDHVWSSHPAAPSLDRKNPSLGYTRDNVQVVCWQINRMRGEFPDHMTRAFAQAFLNATHGESV